MDIILIILTSLGLIGLIWLIILSYIKNSSSTLGSGALDQALTANRMELNQALKNSTDSIIKQLSQLTTTVHQNLEALRKDNHQQLDRMRQTVDEKLQSTLEKRLSESFKLVTEQLETVNKNMGEMQALATDVGDLQKTLLGVKTKGNWGEAHLENLLSEVLNPEQYVKDFKPRAKSDLKVEFALKIPADNDNILYLPIDAKLPLVKFEDLQTALNNGDKAKITKTRKALEAEIKQKAKEINKYINPPITTDFAVMYLPFESLYAEIASKPELIATLRQDYQIAIAGPSTILPMLAMLNLGYRSLTIQKNVSAVWQILRETQAEFSKFGELMVKADKKLTEASNVIRDASTKTRTIEAKFKKVQKIETK